MAFLCCIAEASSMLRQGTAAEQWAYLSWRYARSGALDGGWKIRRRLQLIHEHFRISLRTGQSVTKRGCERYSGVDGCIVYYRRVFVCVGSVVRGNTLLLVKSRSSCMRVVIVSGGYTEMQQLYELAHSKSTSFTKQKKASPLLPLHLPLKFLRYGGDPNTSKSDGQNTATPPLWLDCMLTAGPL